MIIGAHSILYSRNPDADRALLRDVLGLPHVDVGGGWLIFGLPPAEVAVHPSDENNVHELFLMCDDIKAFASEMSKRNIDCGPVLDQMLARPRGADEIDERELCSVVLNHLHPITLTCDVESDQFMFTWPSHVYWIGFDRSWLVAHCFHLHPLAVRGVPKWIDIHTTIDGDYLMGLGADASQLYVCSDSDDFFCVELSPHAKAITTTFGRLKTRDLIRFSLVGCNSLHIKFFAKPIRWRGPSEPKIPAAVAAQAAAFVEAVERGSVVEKARYAAMCTIKRHPGLLIPVNFLRRSVRFMRRRLGLLKARIRAL